MKHVLIFLHCVIVATTTVYAFDLTGLKAAVVIYLTITLILNPHY